MSLASRARLAVRLARVMAHLLAGLAITACVFPFTDGAGRARRTQRWSSQLLGLCGGRLEAGGVPLHHGHVLTVANHVSWLDIFVINAMAPARFIAKAEIRAWPVLGWLVAQAGTIFIARGNRRDLRRIFEGVVGAVQAGERVAFFPEGTTAQQGALLPFHANLFEAAIDARAPVQPYALRYRGLDGMPHAAVDYVGDTTFVQSLVMILRGEPFVAELTVLPAIPATDGHRRELAAQAQAAIAQQLGIPPFA
ncbi:MAG TPA: lysophospholipid acyltransferase family protein [Burkholderiaceae bacterium]